MVDDDARKDLSQKQIDALNKFQENVADVLKPDQGDHFLLVWLRARSFDLKKAEDMLRKNVIWRAMWGADTILTEYKAPKVFKDFYPGGCCGYDKEGCPIWLYPSSDIDMKGISMSAKKSDILRYSITLMETMRCLFKQQETKLGRRIDKCVMISDMDKFSLRQMFQPGMDVVLKFTGIIEANYPETLKKSYVINGPAIFPIIYKMVKPFLSEDTKRKIVILGRDWKSKLLEVIDADQLPQYWGGTDVDPDGNPKCPSKVCLGGTVPEEYFLKGHQLVDEDKVSKVTLNRGSTWDKEVEVTAPGKAIKWVFWTDNYDIKYGIWLKTGSKTEKEMVTPSRVNTHLVPEDGLLKCEEQGTYVLRLDNSYSWVHVKQVSYSIEIVDIDADSADGAAADTNSLGGDSASSISLTT